MLEEAIRRAENAPAAFPEARERAGSPFVLALVTPSSETETTFEPFRAPANYV